MNIRIQKLSYIFTCIKKYLSYISIYPLILVKDDTILYFLYSKLIRIRFTRVRKNK